MKNRLRYICFLLLLLTSLNIYCSVTDSLEQVTVSPVWNSMTDSAKADTYRRLAIELMRKSPERVIEFANKYLELAKSLGSKYEEAIALNLLGGAFKTTGDFDKALDYYKKSLQLREEINDKLLIGNSLNNIGLVYCKKGELVQGLSFFHKSLKKRYEINDKPGIAQTLNNIGVVYKIKGQYDSAFQYLEKSLEIKRTIGDKELIASSLNNLGELYSINDNFKKSSDYFKEALRLRIETDDRVGIVLSSIGIASLTMNYGMQYKSLEYIQSALMLVTDNFNDTNVLVNPEIDIVYDLNIIKLFGLKADLLRNLYNNNNRKLEYLTASLNTYELIIKILGNIRKFYTGENSKLFLLNNSRKYYEDAIEIVLELLQITGDEKYKSQAFGYAEQSKANILADRIRENEAKVFAKIPDSILTREKLLKIKIAEIREKIYSTGNKKDAGWNKQKEIEIFNLKFELNSLIKKIEKDFPSYYKIKYSEQVMKVPEIQSVLSDNNVILEYFLTQSKLFTFIISKNRFNVIRLSVDSVFFNRVGNFYKLLSATAENVNKNELTKTYIQTSYYLYRILIQPVQINYKQKDLIIIPDGILSFIPFEALVTETGENGKTSYKELPYLILKNSATYNYSSLLYAKAMMKDSSTGCKGLLAYAASFKKSNYQYDRKTINRMRTRNSDMAELIGVIDEVENISEIIDGDIFIDKQATECSFKTSAADYCVIHLATHGIIDNENPMFSHLVFEDDSVCKEDGNLYTYELFNMRLNADLAVLSACKTGFGKLHKGEGMMTMARGFLYAGVPSLVISLWNVNDFSTGILMTSFYKYLEQGKDKNEALRYAKLDFINNSDEVLANPFFWADFIQIGNTKPLKIHKKHNWITYTGLLLLLLSFSFAYYKVRNKAQRF